MSLALLYFGGELLVRGASALAERIGLSPLAIGLTVVAFGTSAPELVVSLDAALSGANDISVGNVVGSNIANIGLVLGLAALIRPCSVESKLIRIDAPAMVVASLALMLVLADGTASRLEGLVFVGALGGYCAYTFRDARKDPGSLRAGVEPAAPNRVPGATGAAGAALGGLALLMVGGHLLVTAAVALAVSLGWGQAVIGLTIVAVGTSLPELATSLIASARGEGDIAVGNVIGSNLFNILGILGVTAVVRPLELGSLTGVDVAVMAGMAVLLTTLLALRGGVRRPTGALLVLVFSAYWAWLLLA